MGPVPQANVIERVVVGSVKAHAFPNPVDEVGVEIGLLTAMPIRTPEAGVRCGNDEHNGSREGASSGKEVYLMYVDRISCISRQGRAHACTVYIS